jgi:hypothetical protein
MGPCTLFSALQKRKMTERHLPSHPPVIRFPSQRSIAECRSETDLRGISRDQVLEGGGAYSQQSRAWRMEGT